MSDNPYDELVNEADPKTLLNKFKSLTFIGRLLEHLLKKGVTTTEFIALVLVLIPAFFCIGIGLTEERETITIIGIVTAYASQLTYTVSRIFVKGKSALLLHPILEGSPEDENTPDESTTEKEKEEDTTDDEVADPDNT